MELGNKLSHMRETARHRMLEAKMDHAESQNEELKRKNRMLLDELERDRSERERVLDLLEKATISAKSPTKRRGRFLRLLIAAGAAYVFGAKAGRERYEQIRGWWDRLMNRPEVVELKDRGADMARKATDKAAETADKASRAMDETMAKST
jgi:hypothetical protein